jgi:PAS domain S-box-containing protein
MHIGSTDMQILVIEDNPGDFVLIEDFLKEEINHITIHHVTTFAEAREKLDRDILYSAVLLDLTLPDNNGEKLVKDVIDLTPSVPVIVLTGYTDKEFSVRTLSLGVSDYLLKDDLNATQLFKSIYYSIERNRINQKLRESEEKYRHIFDFSPLPMWVYDLNTFKILNVNEAAIKGYGYSREEFLNLTIKDLRAAEDINVLEESIKNRRNSTGLNQGVFRHLRKNGETFEVDVQSDEIEFNGKKARLVLATDISDQMEYIRAIEKQNLIMRDIAWTQSHVVRAPLARIIGLINLLNADPGGNGNSSKILNYITSSAHELDQIVRDIVRKTEDIEIDFKDESSGNNGG